MKALLVAFIALCGVAFFILYGDSAFEPKPLRSFKESDQAASATTATSSTAGVPQAFAQPNPTQPLTASGLFLDFKTDVKVDMPNRYTAYLPVSEASAPQLYASVITGVRETGEIVKLEYLGFAKPRAQLLSQLDMECPPAPTGFARYRPKKGSVTDLALILRSWLYEDGPMTAVRVTENSTQADSVLRLDELTKKACDNKPSEQISRFDFPMTTWRFTAISCTAVTSGGIIGRQSFVVASTSSTLPSFTYSTTSTEPAQGHFWAVESEWSTDIDGDQLPELLLTKTVGSLPVTYFAEVGQSGFELIRRGGWSKEGLRCPHPDFADEFARVSEVYDPKGPLKSVDSLISPLRPGPGIYGCACDYGGVFAQEMGDPYAYMTIDDELVRLQELTFGRIPNTEIAVDTFGAPGVSVRIEKTSYNICASSDECEGVGIHAKITATKGGRTQTIDVDGGCGC